MMGASLAAFSSSGLAQAPEPHERLEHVAASNSLERPGVRPFHLRMSFEVHDLEGRPTEKGILEEWWEASGKKRKLVVTSPSYNTEAPASQVETDKVARERFLVDLLRSQIVDPIPNYQKFVNLKITEEKHTVGKVDLSCLVVMHVDGTKSDGSNPEYCTNVDGDALRVVTGPGQFAAIRNKPAHFGTATVALDESLSYGNQLAITGHIEALESFTPQTASPAGDPATDDSQAKIPGIVLSGRKIKGGNPVYPFEARAAHASGTVVLHAIISKEGSISRLVVIASPRRSLAEAAVDAVKTWKYQPYLLNDQPTEVDTTVIVNFYLNGG